MTRATVRRAGAADADVVLTLVRENADDRGVGRHVTSEAADWRRLLARDDVVVLVETRNGRVVGYLSALRRVHLWSGSETLALDDLYIRPAWRDGGVDRDLLLALGRYAALERLPVTWAVDPGDERAQRFYARLGAVRRDQVAAARGAGSVER